MRILNFRLSLLPALAFVFVLGCSESTEIPVSPPQYDWTNPSASLPELKAVWGADASNVFAVGNAGTIVRHDGTQWTSMDGVAADLEHLANTNQPFPTADYAIFVAEIASTSNESLLIDQRAVQPRNPINSPRPSSVLPTFSKTRQRMLRWQRSIPTAIR